MIKSILRLYDGFKSTTPELKDDVKIAQDKLKALGYNVIVDGYFGKSTQSIVMKFQKSNNLNADGVIDDDDWTILLKSPVIVTDNPIIVDVPKSIYQTHIESFLKYKDIVDKLSNTYNIETTIVFGIGSRESGWGTLLTPKGPEGTGDFGKRKSFTSFRRSTLPPDGKGFGRGLLQIDYDAHEFARIGNWRDPYENLKYGISLLSRFKTFLSKYYSDSELLIRAALSSYNCGPGNVLKTIKYNKDVDYYTAHRDYSKDVLIRAKEYAKLCGHSSTKRM